MIHGGRIEELAKNSGYMGSNALGRCRELEVEGIIEAIYDNKGCVQYKWKPQTMEDNVYQSIADAFGGKLTDEIITI